ncbi:MAG TPA: hypothetical protein VE224_19425 [Pseudolabrys sp.]|nr:hypothetical protein [Pseudolabrys sp.]
MMPVRVVPWLALAVAMPVAAAVAATGLFAAPPKPCFVAGAHAYRIDDSSSSAVTVRVDKAAAHPTVRIQLVDDPATADFVLVDGSDNTAACRGVGPIKSIRLDPAAAKPDLTVALSQAAAPYKIFVRSTHYTPEDAAALFAVMRQDAPGPEIASRD